MVRTRAWYPTGTFFILAIAASMSVEPALPPVWAAAPNGQEDICTNAAVIYCENWEARAAGVGDFTTNYYKTNGFDDHFGTEISVISSGSVPQGVYNGTKALQMFYPGDSDNDNGGTGFMQTYWTTGQAYRTLYWRWYVKHSSNWLWSPIATKHLEQLAVGGYNNIFMMHGGGTGSTSATQQLVQFGYNTTPSGNFDQNVNGPVTMVNNRWYCLELRLTMNTSAGSSDGYLQGWIDDVQHWEYPNVRLDPTSSSSSYQTGFMVSGYWNCTTNPCSASSANNHPNMYRWIDNIVVSTARIGCLNNSAPSAPTALRIN